MDGCAKRIGFSALLFKKKRGDWGLVLSSHYSKEGNGKYMNGAGKENSPVGEGGLLLLQMFAEKKSEGRGLELENI